MLKAAHIRSIGAALMRALAAMAGVRHARTAMKMVPGDTLKRSSDSQSRHPRIAWILESHELFGTEGKGRKSEPMSKPTDPVMVRTVPGTTFQRVKDANFLSCTARQGAQCLARCAGSSEARTMPVSVRITWHLHVRLTLANKGELKPFANIPGIRSLGNELSSEPLDKQKHIFPNGVDKHYLRKIDDQFQFAIAARCECADLLSSLAGESAFELANQSAV